MAPGDHEVPEALESVLCRVPDGGLETLVSDLRMGLDEEPEALVSELCTVPDELEELEALQL